MPLDFDGLDETDFGEFCFHLLDELGFVNVDWRKGTPKAASPADRGRDIVAEREITDVDGGRHVETWFVDCKHYQAGVPPTALQGLLTWAQAERPHVALVIASGWLTNGAKDFIRQYLDNNRPPFRIKHWERPILDKLTAGATGLLDRFLVGGIRTQSEIITAEEEMFDRVWYTRKQVFQERLADGEELNVPEEILHRMRAAVAAVEARYGKENLGPYDDFEWGMVNGKLSALRWVLGMEWDFLDT